MNLFFAILGYSMVIFMIVLLLKKKLTPVMAFILLPPIAALIAGYSVSEIADFIKQGVSGTMGSALLALCSMVFFSIMTDNGLFDPAVDFMVKKCGNRIAAVTVVAAAIAHISHLDTGSTSTLLVTIPTMLPIFKRMKIDPKILYVIIGQAIGTMNFLPWGGGVSRAAALSGLDPTYIFTHIAPCFFAALIFNFASAWFYGIKAQKAGPYALADAEGGSASDVGLEINADRITVVDGKYWRNLIITLFIIVLVFLGIFPGYYVFMFGLVLALFNNYKGTAEWDGALDKYAKNAYRVSLTMFCAGVFVGVLTKSDLMPNMASLVVGLIPETAKGFYGVICAALAFIVGAMLNADGYMYGMLPLLIESGEIIGYATEPILFISVIIRDTVQFITPTVAIPWMACGMLGVEFRDCFKKILPTLLCLAAVEVVVAIMFGILPIT